MCCIDHKFFTICYNTAELIFSLSAQFLKLKGFYLNVLVRIQFLKVFMEPPCVRVKFLCCLFASGFTPSGGHRSKKIRSGHGYRVAGSRSSSNPNSRAESEDPEASFSSSDESEDELSSRNSLDNLKQVGVDRGVVYLVIG